VAREEQLRGDRARHAGPRGPQRQGIGCEVDGDASPEHCSRASAIALRRLAVEESELESVFLSPHRRELRDQAAGRANWTYVSANGRGAHQMTNPA